MGNIKKFAVKAGTLACALLLGGNCAFAVTAPAGATDQLTVTVRGHITPKCSVTAEGSNSVTFNQMATANDVATGSTVNLPFKFNCNTAYVASLGSLNGGLLLKGKTANGFSNKVDYAAALDLNGSNGAVSVNCDSNTMQSSSGASTGCQSSRSDRGYSAGNGNIKLTLDGGGQPLLAGQYADQLTFLITPNLGGGAH